MKARNFIKKRVQHKCFPVKIAKFLRTSTFKNICKWLLLNESKDLSYKNRLTHYVPVLLSYRNQSIDLHSKSIDWFLHEGNTGIEWVKVIPINSFYHKWLTSTWDQRRQNQGEHQNKKNQLTAKPQNAVV